MSVEFGTCAGCGETICDVDLTACDCGKQFCAFPYGEKCGKIVMDDDGVYSCKFCRNEDITDGELLEFCLEKMNLTPEQAKQQALAQRKNGNQEPA